MTLPGEVDDAMGSLIGNCQARVAYLARLSICVKKTAKNELLRVQAVKPAFDTEFDKCVFDAILNQTKQFAACRSFACGMIIWGGRRRSAGRSPESECRPGNLDVTWTFLISNGVGMPMRLYREVRMRKVELDRLLEKTVADALGVRLPHRRAAVSNPSHAMKAAPRRARHTVRELHPA